MTTRVFSLAIYRLRATFYQRWGGYLAVALLIGLVGGLSMGAIAGARRTQSAFPTYLATTDASNLQAQIWNLQESLLGPASANLTKQLARLPDVQHVASAPAMIVVPLKPNGKPIAAAPAIYGNEVNIDGSVGGRYFHQDRVSVAQARRHKLTGPFKPDTVSVAPESTIHKSRRDGRTGPPSSFRQMGAATSGAPAPTKHAFPTLSYGFPSGPNAVMVAASRT